MPWQKTLYVLTEAFSCSIGDSKTDISRLPHYKKGMHLVTREVVRECEAGLKGVDVGIFTLNMMHTSAGLTVSEK